MRTAQEWRDKLAQHSAEYIQWRLPDILVDYAACEQRCQRLAEAVLAQQAATMTQELNDEPRLERISMANMHYCRFRNTLDDLRDCYQALLEEESLPPEEDRARKRLIALAHTIADEYDIEED